MNGAPGVEGVTRRTGMADERRITCPQCGNPMNHHADKLVAPTGDEPAGAVDPDFGGIIQETHTCPRCATVVFSPAGAG